jgi:hypothetical protein
MAQGSSLIAVKLGGTLTVTWPANGSFRVAVQCVGPPRLTVVYPTTASALQTIWATFPSNFTTGQKLAQLNATQVPGPHVDVYRADIKRLIQGFGIYQQLNQYATSPMTNRRAFTAVNYVLAIVDYEFAFLGPKLALSDPNFYQAVVRLLPDLMADPATGVTQDMVNQLLALTAPLVPWWQGNGFSNPISIADLINAGSLV